MVHPGAGRPGPRRSDRRGREPRQEQRQRSTGTSERCSRRRHAAPARSPTRRSSAATGSPDRVGGPASRCRRAHAHGLDGLDGPQLAEQSGRVGRGPAATSRRRDGQRLVFQNLQERRHGGVVQVADVAAELSRQLLPRVDETAYHGSGITLATVAGPQAVGRHRRTLRAPSDRIGLAGRVPSSL